MGERWLVLSDGARPTEDIYFLESVAPFLRDSGMVVERIDVRGWRTAAARLRVRRRFGANLVVCRTLPAGWVTWLENHRERFGHIVYLIDDDLAAAAEDETLPEAYRQRMASAVALQPRLLDLADDAVACSEALADRLSGWTPEVRVLPPPLIAPLPSREHFGVGPTQAKPWRIGFHGTRAHRQDLEYMMPALEMLMETRRDACLEIMLGEHAPERLASFEGVTTPAPLAWPAFRRYQRRRRLHIGLAPLWDTPFNRGKSWIKFLDIAAMGGVGIYSRRYPYTVIVQDGVNGLLADDDPADWHRCLSLLLNHPEDTRRMADAAAETARQLGDPARAAVFWQSLGEQGKHDRRDIHEGSACQQDREGI
ncbi:glycosyltransferase [Halomonas organivorans]|uniref:Glycosyltransferase n=1 Tax=Halomonas organivorans TaxID=257772 RepID=A0A7W5C0M9_9GAMM|nr:glycosyltransferase [Halomonas organivorans]MBB3142632.1 hypothetical protein [Halomonas organivorans]